MRFTVSVKETIYERDAGRCYRCGDGIEWGLGQAHHRMAGGMGGSKHAKMKGWPSNGLLLCSGCHTWIEYHPTESLDNGWRVAQGGRDPALVPALKWNGCWYRLGHSGELIESLDGPFTAADVDGLPRNAGLPASGTS